MQLSLSLNEPTNCNKRNFTECLTNCCLMRVYNLCRECGWWCRCCWGQSEVAMRERERKRIPRTNATFGHNARTYANSEPLQAEPEPHTQCGAAEMLPQASVRVRVRIRIRAWAWDEAWLMPEICLVVSKYGKSVYNMRATVAPRAGGWRLQLRVSSSASSSSSLWRRQRRHWDLSGRHSRSIDSEHQILRLVMATTAAAAAASAAATKGKERNETKERGTRNNDNSDDDWDSDKQLLVELAGGGRRTCNKACWPWWSWGRSSVLEKKADKMRARSVVDWCRRCLLTIDDEVGPSALCLSLTPPCDPLYLRYAYEAEAEAKAVSARDLCAYKDNAQTHAGCSHICIAKVAATVWARKIWEIHTQFLAV